MPDPKCNTCNQIIKERPIVYVRTKEGWVVSVHKKCVNKDEITEETKTRGTITTLPSKIDDSIVLDKTVFHTMREQELTKRHICPECSSKLQKDLQSHKLLCSKCGYTCKISLHV